MTKNPALITFDSIPAALGLAVDGIAGTFPVNNALVAPLQLVPGPPDRNSPAGLTDEQILAAWETMGLDICYQHGRAVLEHADKVTVFSGGLPPNHGYRVLGSVDTSAAGKDQIKAFAIGYAVIVRRTYETHSPAEMDVHLRRLACSLYGYDVDAIINADYTTIPGGSVFAKGIAIQYTDGPAVGSNASDDPGKRLERLRDLRDRGLITDDEYERKRREAVEGL